MYNNLSRVEDLTIIGAGPAGLYFAYLLTKAIAANNFLVSLHEQTDRIGGRAFTVDIPDSDGLFGEMGAMRFSRLHPQFTEILNSLGLKTSEALYLSTQAFHFVRGKRIELDDYKNAPDKIPYNLRDDEKGLSPAELVDKVIEKIVPGVSKVKTLEELRALLDKTQIEGKSLREWDFGILARREMSEEAYQFVHDTLGFIDHFDNFNAYDKLLHNYHGPGKDPYYVLEGGVKSLVEALAYRVAQQGVRISKNHQLTAVKKAYQDSNGDVYQLSFNDGSTVYTRHVVLTIPPKAMLKLDPTSVIFNNPQIKDIFETSKRSVNTVKITLYYDKPWWHEKGLVNNRIHTNLCVRQIYDIGTTEKGAALMIYKDNGPDWKVQDESDKTLYQNKSSIREDLHIPKQTMNAIQQELCLIFEDNNIPMPTTAFWKVFDEGFVQWNPGVHSGQVRQTLATAHPDITFTGDSIGEGTGWIAGVFDEVETSVKALIQNKYDAPVQKATGKMLNAL